jgi:putative colanic acid biosynthesis UDP-glucose lipid carrier transferase
MLLVNRFLYLAVQKYLNQKANLTRKVLIIGYNQTAKKLSDYLEEENRYTEIVGYCEEEENVRELTRYPIVARLDTALEVSERYGVEEIYSTIAPEQDLGIYQLMKEADQACIRFRVIPDMSYFMNRSFHMSYIRDIPVLTPRKEPLDDNGNRIKKRLFDITVSLFAVVFVLSWLMPILGLLIWLESPGPILFKQLRNGYNNKPFSCFKFRSMRPNSEANQKQATKNDARLTRIGRILRKTSLDEFPQFLNVLTGHMSIVGPRPHMLKHTDDYSRQLDAYMIRQFVKPGITGWAQVNGYRGETKTLEEMQGRVEHDIWYLENWSLWLDVRIIFLTVYQVFRGDKKAY